MNEGTEVGVNTRGKIMGGKRKTGVKGRKKGIDGTKRFEIAKKRGEKQKVEVDKTKMKKYDRGEPIDKRMVRLKDERKKLARKEEKVNYALEQSVRTELLLTEEAGFLDVEDGESTRNLTQTDIQNAVDPISASKRFDLVLKQWGPYRMNYTRNGRFLLLGGERGHVSAMDWVSKRLMCEFNVMESVHDVVWLHQETLYGVAQKKWLYVYDNQGIEIHCVKRLNDVVKLLFLPYHFLLTAVSSFGMISWLDITVGQIVEQFRTAPHQNPSAVAQHPANALVCIGRPSGVVTFWSPNNKKPCITKLCHNQAICSVAFDPRGEMFATAGLDRIVKLWDARNLDGPLQQYTLKTPPNCIDLSHKNFMALGLGNVVEIYKDCAVDGEMTKKMYLRHRVEGCVKNLQFCPYEDILGVAHSTGFSSLLVPGCGEANFDALESNPFQSKKQRKEAEIQRVLNKIPSEFITWDPTELRKIHVPSLETIIEERKKLEFIKPPSIHIEPKYRAGKRSGSAKAVKRKEIMKEQVRREHAKMMMEMKSNESDNAQEKKKKKKKKTTSTVLDRFRPKIKK